MNKPLWKKRFLVLAGVILVGIALIGIFVPVLPTTPLLLLAAACFMNSSDRLYEWLVTHRWFGPYIRNYREHKAITLQAKVSALILLWATMGFTAFSVIDLLSIRILLLLIAVGVTVHISSLKTLTREMLLPALDDCYCSNTRQKRPHPKIFKLFGKEITMSKCRIRLIYWLVLAVVSVGGGILLDLVLQTGALPLWARLIGLAGMIAAHFPLKRTGKLLSRLGDAEKWGCTTRLVTHDIYRCVRHPHHVSVGIFMTSLGLLIGHPWSFLIISISQWAWVFGFLILVEEKELEMKFGEEYKNYRHRVPMLIPKLSCAIRILSTPIESSK